MSRLFSSEVLAGLALADFSLSSLLSDPMISLRQPTQRARWCAPPLVAHIAHPSCSTPSLQSASDHPLGSHPSGSVHSRSPQLSPAQTGAIDYSWHLCSPPDHLCPPQPQGSRYPALQTFQTPEHSCCALILLDKVSYSHFFLIYISDSHPPPFI